SMAAANLRSLSVTVPPASWVVMVMSTLFHEIAMSGWCPCSCATRPTRVMNAKASAKSAKVASARRAPSDSFHVMQQRYPSRRSGTHPKFGVSGICEYSLDAVGCLFDLSATPHVDEVGDRDHDDHITDAEHVGERQTLGDGEDITEPRQASVVDDVGILEASDEGRKSGGAPRPVLRRRRATVCRDRGQVQ